MDTFWERAAHSVNRMFSLDSCHFVTLVVSHFGSEGWTLVLFATVPGHCFPFLHGAAQKTGALFCFFFFQSFYIGIYCV